MTNARVALSQDCWDDIQPSRLPQAAERLGYPTQKPVALLERILNASSNAGDVVLDPFAGCGTTIDAAQKLGRRWIGIDITHLSIALLKYRLENTHGLTAGKEYAIVGEPVDYTGALQLAQDDRHQFEWWALSLIRAKPQGASGSSKQGKKGADRGVDGVIVFEDEAGGKANRALVQVKSGHVNASTIRDLIGTVDNEKAAMGILITLEEPTQPMKTAAAAAGLYHSQRLECGLSPHSDTHRQRPAQRPRAGAPPLDEYLLQAGGACAERCAAARVGVGVTMVNGKLSGAGSRPASRLRRRSCSVCAQACVQAEGR